MYMYMKVLDRIRIDNNISLHTVSMRIQSSHQLVFMYTFTHTHIMLQCHMSLCLSVSPWESSQACCCNQLIILNNSVTIIYNLSFKSIYSTRDNLPVKKTRESLRCKILHNMCMELLACTLHVYMYTYYYNDSHAVYYHVLYLALGLIWCPMLDDSEGLVHWVQWD